MESGVVGRRVEPAGRRHRAVGRLQQRADVASHDYEVDRYGPRPSAVTLAENETRTVELNVNAASLLIDDDSAAVAWCLRPEAEIVHKTLFCRSWEADANLAIRTANRLYNVQTVLDGNGDTLITNDGTIANAFQHMFWNALVVDTVDDADWIAGHLEDEWMERAEYLIDNRYEVEDRQGDLRARRRSRVDVWNNGLGRSYMQVRMDRGLHRERICEGIRRLATTAVKVRWQGRRSDQAVGVINRLRPLWIKRKAWTRPDGPLVVARLLPSETFASGNPCDPLTNSRSSQAGSR